MRMLYVVHTTCLDPLPASQVYVDGANVVPDVWEVLDKIKDFSGGCILLANWHAQHPGSLHSPGYVAHTV